jgi:prepilin signal peptidase PulO-like enzyme (type II secretory pathway)
MLEWILALPAVVLGVLVGSLVAGAAARLAARRPLWGAPRCLLTGQPLAWPALVPVLGYFAQGGRCRRCGRPLPRWAPAVELAMGAIALLAYAAAGPTPRFLIYLAEAAVLVTIFVTDWRRHDIYLSVVAVGAGIALIGGAVLPEIGLTGALAGGVAGGLIMFLLWGLGGVLGRLLYGKPGMAFGDVILGALIGLMTGFPGVVAPLFWGPVLGGGLAVALLLGRKKGLRDYFPYGPGLCLATLIWVLAHATRVPFWDALSLGVLSTMAALFGQIIEKLIRRLLP